MFGKEEELQEEINRLKAENEKLKLRLCGVGSSKRETLDNFSELLNKVIKKTKASDNGLIYCEAGDIIQDVCDNYIIIKK